MDEINTNARRIEPTDLSRFNGYSQNSKPDFKYKPKEDLSKEFGIQTKSFIEVLKEELDNRGIVLPCEMLKEKERRHYK